MKIENAKVYNLEESAIASGYPMLTDIANKEMTDKDLQRLSKWREFCKWIETLPYAKELIIGE